MRWTKILSTELLQTKYDKCGSLINKKYI